LIGNEAAEAGPGPRPHAIVRKPMRSAIIAETLDHVLSGTALPEPQAPPALLGGTTFKGARILVVEDNVVNQRVARGILEKMAVTVTVANHGADALQCLAEADYDLVLMDCQMPIMDGFTATQRIREMERTRGDGQRLPIIALTANVMSQDRENCLAAGMDLHLGKPIEPTQLAECLRRFLRKEQVHDAVDFDAFREMTGGDAAFERELIETFISAGDANLAGIVEALRVQDHATIGQRAHSLKGASANIHAASLTAAAADLESAATAGAVDQLEGLVRHLEVSVQAVKEELRKAL